MGGISRLVCFCAYLSFCVGTAASAVEHPAIYSALLNQNQPAPESHFKSLDSAINYYHELNRHGPWPRLEKGPLLRQGDRHPQVVILRQQLMLLGDYGRLTLVTRDEQYFDQALDEALKRFQSRHGAITDGILGPESRRFLNITPAERIDQLTLNQYRIRQFSEHAGGRYIQVNIPEFRLRLVDQGDVVLQMKTIVGRQKRKTPVFTTAIKGLIMNPSWTVPKSIGWKDIIPAWQADPDYLSRKHLNVAQGRGAQRVLLPSNEVDPQSMYRGGEDRYFWEAPGEGNTLGRLKFMSHSPYAVYLHDTSAHSLFNKERRDLSSGCIRVERAEELAQYLLQLDSPGKLPLLQQGLMTEETQAIYLRHPLPVHMTYWTAWLDAQGMLNFRHDIYRRDDWERDQLVSTAQAAGSISWRID